MTVVGYARVSTDHQSLEAQLDALHTAGCERIFTDKLSGVRDDRPGLTGLLDYVRAGDTVVVVALDRLGRSLSAVIRTIDQLTETGVLLRSIREGIDYSTPAGRMLAGIFAALAGYERELMHERASAAREAARLRGRHTGRPPRLNTVQARQVRALRAGGESITELVRTFAVSRATIYRALQAPPPQPIRKPSPNTPTRTGAPRPDTTQAHETVPNTAANHDVLLRLAPLRRRASAWCRAAGSDPACQWCWSYEFGRQRRGCVLPRRQS